MKDSLYWSERVSSYDIGEDVNLNQQKGAGDCQLHAKNTRCHLSSLGGGVPHETCFLKKHGNIKLMEVKQLAWIS